MSEARRRVIDCGVMSWTAYFTTLPSNGKRTGMTCRRTIFILLPRAPCPARPFCRLRTERYFNLEWRQFKSLGLDAYSDAATESEHGRASLEHRLVMLSRPLLRRSCNWNSSWEFLRSRVTIFTRALEKDSYMRKTCIWTLVPRVRLFRTAHSAHICHKINSRLILQPLKGAISRNCKLHTSFVAVSDSFLSGFKWWIALIHHRDLESQ
jgi:hypothetical protein